MITQLGSGVVSDLEIARQYSQVEERNLQKLKEEDKMTMTMVWPRHLDLERNNCAFLLYSLYFIFG